MLSSGLRENSVMPRGGRKRASLVIYAIFFFQGTRALWELSQFSCELSVTLVHDLKFSHLSKLDAQHPTMSYVINLAFFSVDLWIHELTVVQVQAGCEAHTHRKRGSWIIRYWLIITNCSFLGNERRGWGVGSAVSRAALVARNGSQRNSPPTQPATHSFFPTGSPETPSLESLLSAGRRRIGNYFWSDKQSSWVNTLWIALLLNDIYGNVE